MVDSKCQLCRAAAAMLVAAWIVCLPCAPVALASKRKDATKGWSQEVVPTTDEEKFLDIACQTLQKRMQKQIQTIRSLRAKIASGASAPPGTVLGLLRNLAGERSENADVTAAKARLAQEERAASDLNNLLRTTNCEVVDLDKELSGAAQVDARQAPKPPDRMDDLMRTPQWK
jgi:hypothetical protein